MSIKLKVTLALAAVLSITAIGCFFVLQNAAALRRLDADHASIERMKLETTELALLMKEAQVHILEMQESYVSLFYQTRGQDRDKGAMLADLFYTENRSIYFSTLLEKAKGSLFNEANKDLSARIDQIAEDYSSLIKNGRMMVLSEPSQNHEIEGDFSTQADELRFTLNTLAMDISRRLADLATVAAEQDQSLQKGASFLLYVVTVTSLVATVGTIIIGLWVFYDVLTPLHRLTGAMSGLALNRTTPTFNAGNRRDEIGKMANALEIFTANINAAEALKRLRDIVDTLPVAIFVTDLRGQIDTINLAASKLFQSGETMTQGMSIQRFIPALTDGVIYEAGYHGINARERENRALTLDGTSFPCEISVGVLKDNGTALAVWSVTDTTERLEAQRVRSEMETQLQKSQKMEALGIMAGGVAHELNTPIQFITDNTHFLSDAFEKMTSAITALSSPQASKASQDVLEEFDIEYLLAEVPTCVSQTMVGLMRVSEIVQAVKKFSHPGTEDVEPCDINSLITTTLTICKNSWKYVADIDIQLAPDLPLVMANGGELNQVFLNLIVNAAHAIEDKKDKRLGKIAITTRALDQAVEIRIADTGCGISPDIENKIFDLFFTTKEPGRGTGQGLALVHSIVTKTHNGSIKVQSSPKEGTTFILTLPLNPLLPTAAGLTHLTPPHMGMETPRVVSEKSLA